VSPFLLGGYIKWFFALVVLGVLVSLKSFDFKRIGPLFFFLFTAILAAISAKYLGLFAIALIWVIPHCRAVRLPSFSPLFIAFPLLLYGAFQALTHLPNEEELSQQLARRFPIEECAFLGREMAKDEGTKVVLTHFNSGGWCAYAAHRLAQNTAVRVLVDNRTQGVPDAFYRKAFDLYKLTGNWEDTLTGWRYDALVVARSRPLAKLLQQNTSSLEQTYEGESYLVYQLP
jgi:hypothetical protein